VHNLPLRWSSFLEIVTIGASPAMPRLVPSKNAAVTNATFAVPLRDRLDADGKIPGPSKKLLPKNAPRDGPGRMAGWPDGRMAGWPDGRMAGWPDGWMEGRVPAKIGYGRSFWGGAALGCPARLLE
jgi:hypothetical protein